MKNDFEEFVELLKNSNEILIFTGAGISTSSGIPDYRGPKGFWKTHQPVYYQDFMTSDDARKNYWLQKLEVWNKFKNARPNKIHNAIVKIEEIGKLLMVITQNTDGLHKIAGNSPEKVVELHGTMREVECQQCGFRDNPDLYFKEFALNRIPPSCPKCGGYMKPATISFGQSLKAENIEKAYNAAYKCDLVISLGSTLSVHPASDIPAEAARRGIPYIIINSGPTDHDNRPFVSLRFNMDIMQIFPQAVDEILKNPG